MAAIYLETLKSITTERLSKTFLTNFIYHKSENFLLCFWWRANPKLVTSFVARLTCSILDLFQNSFDVIKSSIRRIETDKNRWVDLIVVSRAFIQTFSSSTSQLNIFASQIFAYVVFKIKLPNFFFYFDK